jgi:NAD-dependent deacetylase
MASPRQGQERAIEEASKIIHQSRHVVAMVGAGMSVESGIPPFRGVGGLWTRVGEPDMRGYQRFLDDPEGHWRNLLNPEREGPRAEFRESFAKARPNPGHYALVELEEMGILKYIITQNLDNLHREAGSQNVAEIHGNRHKLRCIECNLRWMREEFPIRELPPRCPECGGLIKGDGVSFGEPIPRDVLSVCYRETEMCDCMVIIGTSALVYPAASFPADARMRGASLIEVNTDDSALTHLCDVVLQGPSGQVLPDLVQGIRRLGEKPGG